MKIILVLVIALLDVQFSLQNEVVLDSNNLLQNMLIFVKDDVPEGDGSLLKNIKKYITETSKSLLKATSKMDPNKAGVQFGKVSIVIPPKWTAATNEDMTWQQCSKADIFIATKRENQNQDEPLTKQIGNCGNPAESIKISDSFLIPKNQDQIKIRGKKIMTEFAKLRYGVFSEKPYRNQLTVYNGNSFVQSSCSEDIRWTLSDTQPKCSNPDNKCTYSIDSNQFSDYSVMFDQSSNSIEYFCDDSNRPHNILAASLQNIKCNERSISDVILSHSDFKSDSSKIMSFVPPTFTIVRGKSRNIVLVLDVSNSMRDIIHNMILAAVQFVQTVVEDSAQLGLVAFGTSGEIKNNLLPMNNAGNRNQIINAIRNLVISGYTNIPDGLRKGIQVLGGNMANADAVFGTIVLLSDGQNNIEPNIWNDMSVINTIISKGIVINSIAYGLQADDKLNKLASGSGGKYFYANTDLSYTDLMNIFALRSSCESVDNATIKVSEGQKSIDLSKRITITNLFYADEFMGQNLFLTMTFNQDISKYDIKLIDPLKTEYAHVSSQKQGSKTTLVFQIIGSIEVGVFQLKMTRLTTLRLYKRSTTIISTTYIVSAVADKSLTRIITPSGQLSQSEIQMVNDTTTIFVTVDLSTCGVKNNEKVSTILLINHPSQKMIEREMRDDGLGCDSIGRDQIYSTCIYPMDLKNMNYYTMKAEVEINSIDMNNTITRTVDVGSLRVGAIQASITDKIPPARIEEIDLSIIDKKEKILKINFVSTGNDGLIGNLRRFQINIKSENNSVLIELKKNATPLKLTSFTLNLFNETTDTSFRLSIRGIDASGNEGQWSPEQRFSWNYNEDRDRYNKLGTMNGFNPLFIMLIIFVGRLVLE